MNNLHPLNDEDTYNFLFIHLNALKKRINAIYNEIDNSEIRTTLIKLKIDPFIHWSNELCGTKFKISQISSIN